MTFIRSGDRRSYKRERVEPYGQWTDHIPLAHARSYDVSPTPHSLAGARSYQTIAFNSFLAPEFCLFAPRVAPPPGKRSPSSSALAPASLEPGCFSLTENLPPGTSS